MLQINDARSRGGTSTRGINHVNVATALDRRIIRRFCLRCQIRFFYLFLLFPTVPRVSRNNEMYWYKRRLLMDTVIKLQRDLYSNASM